MKINGRSWMPTKAIIIFKNTISYEKYCRKNVMRWLFHDTHKKMVENTQECFQRCNFVRTISAITTDKNPIAISIYRNERRDLFYYGIYVFALATLHEHKYRHNHMRNKVKMFEFCFCVYAIHVYFTFYSIFISKSFHMWAQEKKI